jgi:hypothetical protein
MPQSSPPRSRTRDTRRARVRSLSVAGLVSASLTAPLAAQSSTESPFRIEPFAARNEATSASTFGGLSVAGYAGSFGLRLNGAVAGLDVRTTDQFGSTPQSCSRFGCRNGVRRTNMGPRSNTMVDVDAWTVDGDLIVEPFRQVRILRALLLGFSPYSFVGIGRFGTSPDLPNARNASVGVWSYGAGLHHELAGRLGVTAEARVRRRLDDNAFIGATFRDAMQYRVGLSVGVGSTSRRRAVAAETPRVVRRTRPWDNHPVADREADRVSVTAPVDAAVVAPRLIDTAEGLLGAPWTAGGTTPEGGFDTGGFVQYLYGTEGIQLPRMVRELSMTGALVSARVGALRPGDLLFFSSDGIRPDHVAMFVGRDRIVHASATGNGVVYDVLGEGPRGEWFSSHLFSARRILDAPRTPVAPSAPSLEPSGRPDRAPRPVRNR